MSSSKNSDNPNLNPRLAELISKYHAGQLTLGEEDLLFEFLEELDRTGTPEPLTAAQVVDIKNNLKQFIKREEKVIHWPSITRIAASLLILMVVGYALYYYTSENTHITQETAQVITPGSDKAVLQLADGSKLILDQNVNSIPSQGGATVSNNNGSVSYAQNASTGVDVFNIMSTPNGGKYHITLADGTGVWMNAASSLKFPASFTSASRVVELQGEAYFEVAKDVSKPFVVRIRGGSEVEVLGTHFNVMSYEDEDAIKATLLEGSVKFSRVGNDVTLKPFQQAISKEGMRAVVSTIDNNEVSKTMAWKNGRFIFEDVPLEGIMRQVARWYNVEIIYGDDVRQLMFTADIARDSEISSLLESLELTGAIHFSIDGRTITVKKGPKA